MRTGKQSDVQAALHELAALFEYGELEASTRPAHFIRTVVAEIKRLRAERPAKESSHG